MVAAWEAEEYLASVVGRRMTDPELFGPVTARHGAAHPQQPALRLFHAFRVDRLLDVLRLQPSWCRRIPHLWRDRAVLHFRQEAWEGSRP